MPPVSGPLGPRRKIATTLSNWRRESEQSLAEVQEVTLISTSKLSRLENAEGKPRLRDVRDLIRHYGKEGTPQAGQLERWVKAAEVPGWWTDFSDDVLTNRLDTLLAYEADAAVARIYTLPFVPALLQIDAYTEAVYRDMEHRPEDQIGKLLEIRRGRKEALKQREGLEPLELVAVTHECTLRQIVGSPEIMRDQLDELLVRSYDDNVSLYVFPFSARPAFTMTCMWAYWEYQDPEDLEQDLVQFETPAGFWTIEDPGQVAGYRKAHDSLIDSSLNEDDSRALIRSIRDDISTPLAKLSPLCRLARWQPWARYKTITFDPFLHVPHRADARILLALRRATSRSPDRRLAE